MTYPNMYTVRGGLLSLALVTTPLIGGAQTLSNGLGGGDWSSSATWAGGTVPSGGFSIQAGDTVTAGGAVTHSTGSNSVVHGTFAVDGADIQISRLNYNIESFGTVNVNSGRFSVSRVAHTSSSRVNVNLTGGTFEIRDNIAVSAGITFDIDGGQLLSNATSFNHYSESGVVINLSGGSLVFQNGNSGLGALGAGSWTGGAVYLNNSTMSVGTASTIINAWSSNIENILGISSKETKQTLAMETEISAMQGVMGFNIYSATTNDSDLFISNQLTLGEDVSIRISAGELVGSIQDYIGSTYQLFSVTGGDYSGIAASIEDSSLTIGGVQYDDIRWDTSNLAFNGTVSLVPEPSTYALMAGGLAMGLAIVRRRKKA